MRKETICGGIRRLLVALTIMMAVTFGVTTGAWALFIYDNATGGDCTSIGNWDSATKTCTLTTDLSEPIEIKDNYITLDGDGYTITGSGSLHGVLIYYPLTGVTVKNLKVTGFRHGISIYAANGNTLIGNTVWNNRAGGINLSAGIWLRNARGNTLEGNTAYDNYHGIWLDYSAYALPGNILINNTVNFNSFSGIRVMSHSNGNTIVGNTVNSNGHHGIFLHGRVNGNTVTGNTVQDNRWSQIHLYSLADGNTVSNNTVSGSKLEYQVGIQIRDGDSNIFRGNTVSNTHLGIHLWRSTGNTIYHNNIIDNITQASDTNPASNDWYESTLLEGNFWSDYMGVDNGSGEDKHAIAGDGIGDILIPHPAADFDFYPFVNENGWEEPANQPPVANANGPYETKTLNVLADIDPDTLNINSKGKWVTAYLVTDSDGIAQIPLDGGESYDPDGDELSYSWTIFDDENNVIAKATGVTPIVELPVGEFDVELIVNDGNVDSDLAYSTITVELLDLAFVYPDEITLRGPAEEGSAVSGDWGEMQDAETLMVKFYREALIPTLIPEEENEIQVGGAVTGEDTIMVINRGGGKGKKK